LNNVPDMPSPICPSPICRAGSKRGVLPKLRKELARKGVEEYGISLAKTARQLGVTTNAVSYMLKRDG
jgi:predicted transcriptional regulator